MACRVPVMAAAASTRAFHDESHHCPATALPAHFAGRVDRPRADPAVGTDPGPQGAPPSRDSPSISRVVSFISAAGAARRVARVPRSPRRLGAPARGRGNRGRELPLSRNADVHPHPRPRRCPPSGYPHHGCPRGKQPHHRPAQGPHPEQRARERARASPTRRGHRGTARRSASDPPQAAEMTDQERKLESESETSAAPAPETSNHAPSYPRAAPRRTAPRQPRRWRPAPPPLDPSAVARGGDDRVAHLAPPRWRRHRRARKEEEDRGTTRGGAHPFDG